MNTEFRSWIRLIAEGCDTRKAAWNWPIALWAGSDRFTATLLTKCLVEFGHVADSAVRPVTRKAKLSDISFVVVGHGLNLAESYFGLYTR